MKVALVHDFLMYWGGAERVLQGFTRIFPQACIYTLFYDKAFVRQFFPETTVHASFLQKFPLSHRFALPLMPFAVERFLFNDIDVVISSGAFAKGIITPPHTVHIDYCHTPPRFLWEETGDYLATQVPFGFRTPAQLIMYGLRMWDVQAAMRPDIMIANSQWTQRKIKKVYRRKAEVIYPFVEAKSTKRKVQHSSLTPKTKNYILIVSRLQLRYAMNYVCH
jgi:hypothetical protein